MKTDNTAKHIRGKIIAIDGRCASGKTTFSNRLAAASGAHIIRADDFFLQPHQRTPERFAQPGGNLDRERFITEVIEPLSRKEPFSYRPYDAHKGYFKDPVYIDPSEGVIIEGSYSCQPMFGDFCDLRIFMTVDPSLQKERLIQRSGAELYKRFESEWIPLEEAYFSAFGLMEKADIVIDGAYTETAAVLFEHTLRYPVMQPTDAVKLLYQNEFGGGHLVKDEAMALKRIEEEYASLPAEQSYENSGTETGESNGTAPGECSAAETADGSTAKPGDGSVRSMFEDIGNGLVRAHLGGPYPEGYDLKQLAADFVRSSAAHKGELSTFIEKLALLKAMLPLLPVSFTEGELDEYLEAYKEKGYPMVSHSETYRQAYKPAYRVMAR